MKRQTAFLASLALAAALAPAARAGTRSELYLAQCAVCHGDDGASKTEEGQKKGARDLTKKKWQDAVSDERLSGSIAKGRGKMPAFGSKLSADEIKALVAEVRQLAAK